MNPQAQTKRMRRDTRVIIESWQAMIDLVDPIQLNPKVTGNLK
jgi:hypothetical protein